MSYLIGTSGGSPKRPLDLSTARVAMTALHAFYIEERATMDDIRTFTPADDIYEDLKSGRGRVIVAHAGVAMPWSRLRELGLVDPDGKPTVKGKTEQPESEKPAKEARG